MVTRDVRPIAWIQDNDVLAVMEETRTVGGRTGVVRSSSVLADSLAESSPAQLESPGDGK